MDSNSHLIAHGQGRRARHALVWGCVLLLATGVAWLVGHDVWLQQTAFGPQPHPLVAWLLRAHGAIAWCVTLVAGVVWQVHVRPAWRAVRRRRLHRRRVDGGRARTASGVGLVAALAVLLGSAIGLQYAPEEAHAALSVTHWAIGLALAIGLIWHWIARLRR